MFRNSIPAFGNFSLDSIANRQAIRTLAGRNVVMLVLTLLTLKSLKSQNAMFLAYTFLMHLIRELQDMFIVPYCLGFTTPKGVTIFSVFLVAFVVQEFIVLLKLRARSGITCTFMAHQLRARCGVANARDAYGHRCALRLASHPASGGQMHKLPPNGP